MMQLLEAAKAEQWARVLATHQALLETRTEAAADAHRDALLDWWQLAELHHREVLARLNVFAGTESSTEAGR